MFSIKTLVFGTLSKCIGHVGEKLFTSTHNLCFMEKNKAFDCV